MHTPFGRQTQQMLVQVLLHLRSAKILPLSESLPRWPLHIEVKREGRKKKETELIKMCMQVISKGQMG